MTVWACCCSAAALLLGWAGPVLAQDPSLHDVVQAAYLEVHDGWSAEEVLLQDSLQESFLAACRRRLPAAREADFNWTLLNRRKAGQLAGQVTRRRHDVHDGYRHLAEIAARLIQDQHRVTTDQMLCDPQLRREFDRNAQGLTAECAPYLLRKAVLALRKQRRLRPELVPRVVAWGREIRVVTVDEARRDVASLPARPGVYLFRDDTGYLYIGEASDLRARLSQHVRQSDRTSLANYLAIQAGPGSKMVVELHIFDPDSPASQATMRRAYESELIASRTPRFNVRP